MLQGKEEAPLDREINQLDKKESPLELKKKEKEKMLFKLWLIKIQIISTTLYKKQVLLTKYLVIIIQPASQEKC